MKRFPGLLVAAAAVSAAAASVAAYRALSPRFEADAQLAVLERFCTECHNDLDLTAGVSFEGLTAASIPEHSATFEIAVRNLRGRLMPPPGSPRPDEDRIDELVAFIETSIDSEASREPAGHVPIHRLNRTEYAASVKDLLGVEIDAEEMLPADIEVDGFTNIAAALSVSPAFLEQYVSAARTIAHIAVGTRHPKMSSAYYPPPFGDQDDYVDSLPPGTRGGMRFEHRFPADGTYRITLTDLDVGLYPRSLETEQTVVVLVDRREVFRGKLGGAEDLALVDRGGAPARAEIMARFADIPIETTAGRHEIIVTFIERARASTEELIGGFTPYGGFSYAGAQRVPRIIGGIEVSGPFETNGLSRTASRDKIFVCEPETLGAERPCARRIAANLARRAFRRPVGQQDLDRLMPFYDTGREGPGGFDAGIEHLVAAVLASPDFLYRRVVPPSAIEGDAFALDDIELASRLSFFLWSRGPDDELLALAEAGELGKPEVLDAQVRRMLADPRAETLVTDFALRWLNVDDLDAVEPDDRLFPGFDETLRQAFATEIELFLRSVLLEDRGVHELLTAEHTFLNEHLARHYGIDGVLGPQFRRVELDDPRRFGLLGKAAVLLRTSYGDRTSPVLRGAWVLDKLMGTPPAPPPPNVETDLTTPEGERPTTVRERLERHRESASCNGCHGVIDPYGLALENFTVVGEWRDFDREAGAPIDARTVLPGGAPIDGPIELRDALLARQDQFPQALTSMLMMYAIGRELEHYDMPEVRAIVAAAEKQDYRFSAIVRGIVASDAFRMQALPEGLTAASASPPPDFEPGSAAASGSVSAAASALASPH